MTDGAITPSLLLLIFGGGLQVALLSTHGRVTNRRVADSQARWWPIGSALAMIGAVAWAALHASLLSALVATFGAVCLGLLVVDGVREYLESRPSGPGRPHWTRGRTLVSWAGYVLSASAMFTG